MDTTHLYKNIETISKRNKFSKFLYQFIFKPASSNSQGKNVKKSLYKKLIQKSYISFEGKIIRHINIVTLDPFGYSVADTSRAPRNFIANSGNKIHVKSLKIAIRNLLLIRENQSFDSLLVKESERLVRSQVYIHDVSFLVKSISLHSDSVDIFIREVDNWSLIPQMATTNSSFTININDKNVLGTGHSFQNGYTRDFTKGMNAFNTSYYIPNVRNTYINSTLRYGLDEFGNFSRSFAIDRPFFSPFARWAAGLILSHQYRTDSIHYREFGFQPVTFKVNTQDYWGGEAIQLFKGNTEVVRTTNLITTLRFLRIRYHEKPTELLDSLHNYSNENFYMGGIGISTRKYVQDKYIFNYGLIEDVPIGKVYGLTLGYQVKNNIGRTYVGLRYSFGNYNEWGYLSTNIEYGTFIRSSHLEQGVITAGINYFTGLIEAGRWKFRQFIKPQLTFGINRFAYDSLTLKDGSGLDGFNSLALIGVSRMIFTLQTQAYSPLNFLGFRFGPYFICSFGMLGDAESQFRRSKVYSLIGLGVLIKNDHLVLNTFQISISFYPVIPGKGNNVFKLNSFKTTDFGFRDFEIGKPGVVSFQ